jgi:hypothetical protein
METVGMCAWTSVDIWYMLSSNDTINNVCMRVLALLLYD